MYYEFLSNRISELRQLKGVSAREMSLSIGQNRNYINRIENGKTLPSLSGFFYICEYLDITPKEFFDTDVSNPVQINNLIEEAKNLDHEALDLLIGISKKINK